ncbi:MAG: hydroxyacid dehydrogenase [Clostridia bacterium]|nr:hydroxyacid dehydrogenase [Clostridia bacterium]
MNIVILDRGSLGEDTPFDGLEALGDVTSYFSSTQAEAIERVKYAEVIIINKVKITEEVIAAAPRLRLVCVFATGFDNIDISAARERGIGVCNVPGYSTPSVAQFTVATVLSLYSHLSEYNEFVRSGEYTRAGVPNRLIPVYHEIAGKTWGIVGYGNIGSAVARIADAMGARVIVNKRTRTEDYTWVDIDTLCREADIITIHCPLNDESRELINEDRIAMMKKDVVIVNAARGAVLCEEDVADAVKKGSIGAFGADVYSVEPFGEGHPFDSIKGLPNVLLTPHAAWGSYEARVRCINTICSNIKAFFDGKIQNRVDI